MHYVLSEQEESTIVVQEQKLSEENQVKGSKLPSTGGSEEQHTGNNRQWGTKRKRPMEEDEEMRKIFPFFPILTFWLIYMTVYPFH